jgi:hypothetical protein
VQPVLQIALNTRDPYHIIYRGQKGALVNLDLTTNNILVGPDEGAMFSSNPECFILGPLNSVMMDASRDYWAIALTGNPPVAFMEGASNWNPSPAQIQEQLNALGLATEATQQVVKANTQNTATNVSTVNTTLGVPAQTADVGALHAPGSTIAVEASNTGIPLLRFAQNLGHNTSQVIPANTTANLVPVTPVVQPSFEMVLWTQFVLAPAQPFGRVLISWEDSTGNFLTQADSTVVPGGTGAFAIFYITGPIRGEFMKVQLQNLDAANALTCEFTVNQTSHIYDELRVLEVNGVAISGFTRPGLDPTTGVLASLGPSINPLATITRLPCVWAGPAMIDVDNQAGANACKVSISDPGGNGASSLYNTTGTADFAAFNVAAGATQNTEVSLPNGPITITVTNLGSTGNISPGVQLTRKFKQ